MYYNVYINTSNIQYKHASCIHDTYADIHILHSIYSQDTDIICIPRLFDNNIILNK